MLLAIYLLSTKECSPLPAASFQVINIVKSIQEYIEK
jgi:hypothetical protein